MSRKDLSVHLGSLDDMGERFAAAWREAEAGRDSGRHVTFIDLDGFARVMTPRRLELVRALKMRGPASIRSLALALGRDYKAVHSDVAALIAAGLILRSPSGQISVPWDRITAELDLKAA